MVSSSYYRSIFASTTDVFEANGNNPSGNNSLPTYDEIITDGVSNNLLTGCTTKVWTSLRNPHFDTSAAEPPSYSEAMEQMLKKDKKGQN